MSEGLSSNLVVVPEETVPHATSTLATPAVAVAAVAVGNAASKGSLDSTAELRQQFTKVNLRRRSVASNNVHIAAANALSGLGSGSHLHEAGRQSQISNDIIHTTNGFYVPVDFKSVKTPMPTPEPTSDVEIGVHENTNKRTSAGHFMSLSNELEAGLCVFEIQLSNLLLFKDELTKHNLPPAMITRLLVIVSQIFRSKADLANIVWATIQNVRIYSGEFSPPSEYHQPSPKELVRKKAYESKELDRKKRPMEKSSATQNWEWFAIKLLLKHCQGRKRRTASGRSKDEDAAATSKPRAAAERHRPTEQAEAGTPADTDDRGSTEDVATASAASAAALLVTPDVAMEADTHTHTNVDAAGAPPADGLDLNQAPVGGDDDGPAPPTPPPGDQGKADVQVIDASHHGGEGVQGAGGGAGVAEPECPKASEAVDVAAPAATSEEPSGGANAPTGEAASASSIVPRVSSSSPPATTTTRPATAPMDFGHAAVETEADTRPDPTPTMTETLAGDDETSGAEFPEAAPSRGAGPGHFGESIVAKIREELCNPENGLFYHKSTAERPHSAPPGSFEHTRDLRRLRPNTSDATARITEGDPKLGTDCGSSNIELEKVTDVLGLLSSDSKRGGEILSHAIKPEDMVFTFQEVTEFMIMHAKQLEMMDDTYKQEMADLEQKLQDQPTWNPDTESIDESIDEDIEPSSSKQPKALVQTRKKKRRVTKAKPTKRIGNLVERLEQWAVENMKRKVALSHDIYSKQSHELEKQIATQHRLQRKVMEPPATPCLPALFLPNKGLVYNPRATNRWHPNGSNQRRVTQAPSIFKLPELRRLTAAPPVENRQATLATHNMSDRVMTMDRSD